MAFRRFWYTVRPSSTAASIEAKLSSVEQQCRRLLGRLRCRFCPWQCRYPPCFRAGASPPLTPIAGHGYDVGPSAGGFPPAAASGAGATRANTSPIGNGLGQLGVIHGCELPCLQKRQPHRTAEYPCAGRWPWRVAMLVAGDHLHLNARTTGRCELLRWLPGGGGSIMPCNPRNTRPD